ncbi:hypothetical protein [Selenomonas sp. CM52]|uniref:hypothetical protein n=1 Tax=Selenomonas sp. CM52 TaxID=936381 RepID=UPI00027C4041|nr:hypothetical protein [Selenomonas sp. CM52]EJU26575.1 hypothetical protein HMPREF1153_1015 [Selenomonas sp. CM52]
MKIQGNGDGAIGMKKGLLQSERLVGNKGHESTIAAMQKQKEYAGELGKSAGSPAYHVSVSKEGRGLAVLHGTATQSGSETAMQDAVAKQSVEQMDMSGTAPLKPLRAEDLDWATEYEQASLAETMRGVESGIGAVLRGAAENPLAVGADIQMYLVRQLNAYGHHQKALGHSLAGDPYLSSVLERLDALDPKGENPLVSEIRSLVSTTMSGKNIELFEKDGHSDLVRRYCAYLGIHMGDAMKVKDKADDYFNDKTAIYAFFQEMSRKAKCTEELLEAMLGDRAGEKEEERERPSDLSQLIAERKSGLEDGMTVYKESLRKLHRADGDAGEGEDGKLSERESAEEKKSLIPSVTGYDWQCISEKYLHENPELAAIFAENGMG